ncbi:MAG: hypothetical protein NDI61_13645 [Bdellovibrionaceae bacterium]|nr:hypothetical protein [Pseudobdellovibrionaceae bacterium]
MKLNFVMGVSFCVLHFAAMTSSAADETQASPSATVVDAAPAPEAAKPASSKSKTAVQREMKFEDLLVQGKYHFADEAVVTVEEDKVLDALLGQRTDFKDRIQKSATRQ